MRLPRLPGLPVGSEGGAERWLITYADMITLLLVMFVVLYSTANTDLEKFKALAESLAEGFGATVPTTGGAAGEEGGMQQGTHPIYDTSGGGTSPIALFPERQTPIQIFQFAEMLAGEGEGGELMEQLRGIVEQAAEEAGLGEGLDELGADIRVSYNERGIVISIYPDQILFDSGSARLKPAFRQILDLLAPQLARLPNQLEVHGHTDSVPISTATYPSNWELSGARAGAVSRHLINWGIPAQRLQVAGHADTLPVDTNATAEGRARNRRVELVVLRMSGESMQQVAHELESSQ